MKRKDLRNPKSECISLGDWIESGRSILKNNPNEPLSSLYALVGHILGKPNHYAISHPEYRLSREETALLDGLLKQLISGVPLPYLTSRQSFYGLEFFINTSVLIPRPETELLVESALDWLKTHAGQKLAIDVGTGSGCIAVAICANAKNVRFISTDKSLEALMVARKNISAYQLEKRILLAQTDLLKAFSGSFDLICANLPYIPSSRLPSLLVSRHEPLLALNGGEDGLNLIEDFLRQAAHLISSKGVILLEIDFTQNLAVEELAKKLFPFASIKIMEDLAGLPRIVVIQLI